MEETALARKIRLKIEASLPDAEVTVTDPDGAHLTATIKSAAFRGKSRLEQHRMVYAALGNSLAGELHALQIIVHST